MSTDPNWGFCAAYGCPLLGVHGISDKWYCCCHFNVNPSLNDAITAELHRQKTLVDKVLAARRIGEASAPLENELIELTRQIGRQQSIPGAGVIGPTHAMQHYAEIDQ